MAVDVTCPACNTRDIRTSRPSSLRERILEFFGAYNLCCNRCGARFRDSLWKPKLVLYARCPRCLRTELSRWDRSRYNPPASTLLLLQFGAKPYRCDACRCNFASFRARKQKSEWRNYRGPRPPSPPDEQVSEATSS